MSLPKVLVFTPIYEGKEYCLDYFLDNAKKINYPNYEHIFVDNSKNKQFFRELKKRVGKKLRDNVYYVGRGNNSREALSRAQEFARRYMLENDFKFMLSLESDLFPPADVIQRLMLHNRLVVGALYHIGDKDQGVRVPCISVLKPSDTPGLMGTRLLDPEEFTQYYHKGLQQVHHCGLGCTLIHRKILEQVSFFYDHRYRGHSDIWFANDLHGLKLPVFVDTDLIVAHDNRNWDLVADR